MGQHFSTQTNSSPEGDRQGVAFTPFQYKQQIKKLKSGFEPKSLPNIPTSASGSDTFSTPPGVNSTSQKPYSSSQNLPTHALEMIISAILSLRYNIPCSASHILNPSLNLLINSIISSSGGHSTPAFHVRQDHSTTLENLQLEPMIENYICCPQCFFLNVLTESVTTDQPHGQHHNEPNKHDSPYTQ
ncbi:hypothetical protein O181_095605 [Austropuccinia psidii MF-1]|uniref:Uncharacterized protein n=1 Tax=Austropuccinia psidii MF-1 TaxID=1389203 RepID=A0A9Q3PC75_9BASI|nr:hypothetical protein [Austropuccinia psidii MF-1]